MLSKFKTVYVLAPHTENIFKLNVMHGKSINLKMIETVRRLIFEKNGVSFYWG